MPSSGRRAGLGACFRRDQAAGAGPKRRATVLILRAGSASELVGPGHVRVSLEDSLLIARGQLAKLNAEQVAKIARILREMGKEPATPDEARTLLGLKGRTRS